MRADLRRSLTLAAPQAPLAPRQLWKPHTAFPARTQSYSTLARERLRQGFKGIKLRFGELKRLACDFLLSASDSIRLNSCYCSLCFSLDLQ